MSNHNGRKISDGTFNQLDYIQLWIRWCMFNLIDIKIQLLQQFVCQLLSTNCVQHCYFYSFEMINVCACCDMVNKTSLIGRILLKYSEFWSLLLHLCVCVFWIHIYIFQLNTAFIEFLSHVPHVQINTLHELS